MAKILEGFIDFFKQVPDHRVERQKLHPVEELLLVAFCGMIAGCDSWDDLELFGRTKLEYLRKHLPFKNGPPSDDTLRRFFRVLDPSKFEACFMRWVQSFRLNLEQKVVAIDGKTSRRSFDDIGRAMHMISAFASEAGLVLGQLKVEDKTNEITAIPQLIELLDLSKATVTIDSMGCQTKIAEKILEKEANYVFGLKGNQSALHEDVQLLFKDKPLGTRFLSHEVVEKGHGRIETRKCTVTEEIDWLKQTHAKWPQLRSVVEIESTREVKEKISVEKRYYISSHVADPILLANAVRQHWGVENKLHWVLDISFGDDQSRIRKGNAPQNMAIIKKTVLNLLRIIKKDRPRVSLKGMRKMAGWSNDFLDTVLVAQF